jgi:hypothetical protein
MNSMARYRCTTHLALGVLGGMAWFRLGAGQPVEPVRNPFAADEWRLPAEAVSSAGTSASAGAGVKGPLESHCQLCHSLDYVTTQPDLTRPQWSAIVEKMRGKFGAVIPTNQVPGVIDAVWKAGSRTGDGNGRR